MDTPSISRFPASFAQRRLWFIQQFAPESAAYNMVVSVELPRGATLALMQRALDRLCAHRETLRTSFAVADGDVVQQVQPESRIELCAHELASRKGFGPSCRPRLPSRLRSTRLRWHAHTPHARPASRRC